MGDRFGIPYAYCRVKNGRLIRTCPICGIDCAEGTDTEGEQTTNNYGEHYEREHAMRLIIGVYAETVEFAVAVNDEDEQKVLDRLADENDKQDFQIHIYSTRPDTVEDALNVIRAK